ncbi:branched-chain amino acid ABC transporter permease [Phreatobacter oligotrophus]|jgi:branched-chain amino acid transport system permease protein|uniref:Amino acid/amide ABC transporter membrane protein 2 (HAAT family) n=1 Tax=Phreatobacter oligotrophus TaxID=1122261 RepID=A0A2T4YWE2_9HYPH|nr:branched-chain amino acid ABC transporter permease [Phreatobacter oligotrophus]MBX9991212.1 branched-chain amino acid ABC transporter permease [Phreatobacter oligotrophus]PTM48260.1 amino acid/amide ABC transporter membrane protein 2 (HAAT family) [Phreatobacter oligotrophus]
MRFIFKTRYEQDIELFQHGGKVFWYGLLMAVLLIAPVFASPYVLTQLSQVCIYAIVAVGLMLLAGFTGQLSLGHAAFMAVGAYTQGVLVTAGVPFFVGIVAAALFAAAVGVIVGLPALRVKGLYLGIATLAFGTIIEEIIARAEHVTGGNAGLMVPPVNLFGWRFADGPSFYYLCLAFAVAATLIVINILRSPTGRAFVAIRDSEISAQSMGVNLAFYKTLSFAISAAFAGVAGGLYAHNIRFLSPDQFTVVQSIELVMMVVIGGLGSVHGAIYGAAFLIALPQMINAVKPFLPLFLSEATGLQPTVFGAVLILVVLFEPLGIYGAWLKTRTYFDLFPFYRQGMFRRQKAFQKSDRLK